MFKSSIIAINVHVHYISYSYQLSEWVCDCCLTPIQQFFSYMLCYISWREEVNFQWDDDEVHFVLDQHAELDFYSSSSLKQQSAGRHVDPLGHIIWFRANQSLLLILNAVCLAENQQIPILLSLVWLDQGSKPMTYCFEASTLTITPPMRFRVIISWTNFIKKINKILIFFMIKFNVTLLICILLKIRERTNIKAWKNRKHPLMMKHRIEFYFKRHEWF